MILSVVISVVRYLLCTFKVFGFFVALKKVVLIYGCPRLICLFSIRSFSGVTLSR